MKQEYGFKLGMSVDLTKGFKRDWMLTDCSSFPLFVSPKSDVEQQDIESLDLNAIHQWKGPVLSFHEDATSLLSELFPYQIVSGSSVLPSGVLLFEDADRESVLKQYSSQLQVNLSDPDSRFVLVKLIKSMGKQSLPQSQSNESPHSSKRQGHANRRLPDKQISLGKSLSSDQTERRNEQPADQTWQQADFPRELEELLRWFHEHGTHYVAKVELGDIIFQVFAYSAQRFEQIRASYQTGKNFTSGSKAIAFNYFTTNAEGSVHGYVKEYGQILSLSNCSQLTKDVELGLWNDSVWSKNNSIFSVFEGGSLTLSHLAENHRNVVPIRVTLRELFCLFDPSIEERLVTLWNAILSVKYQDHVRTPFANPHFDDYAQLASQGDQRLISVIATPEINVYKEFFDLDQMQLSAKELIKDLAVYTNILNITVGKDCELPGNRSRLAASVVNSQTSDRVKKMLVSDSAFNEFELYCAEFYGALRIVNQSRTQSKLIVNGLVFQRITKNQRYEMAFAGDIRRPIDAKNLDVFKSSISYAFLYAQQIANQKSKFQQPLQRTLAQKSLTWIMKGIPEAQRLQNDIDLAELRLMVHSSLREFQQEEERIFVPILPYRSYKEYADETLKVIGHITDEIHMYQEKLDARHLEEQLVTVGQTLNENIIQTGNLITDTIKTSAQSQEDLFQYYRQQMGDLASEDAARRTRIEAVADEIKIRSKALSASADAFQTDCAAYMARQVVDGILNLAINLFDGLATVTIPVNEYKQAKNLSAFYQKTQKWFAVFEAFDKAISGGAKDAALFVLAEKAYRQADKDTWSIPTDADWNEFEINMNYMLDLAPIDSTIQIAKAKVIQDLKLLVLKGRELQKLQLERYESTKQMLRWNRQQQLAAQQKKRLERLESALHPNQVENLDISQIDLVGMTGELEHMRRQMLGILSETFYYMDEVLQYETMQAPTPVSGLSLLNMASAINQQLGNKLSAETKWNAYQKTTTLPISIQIEGIPTAGLTDGQRWTFFIRPDQKEFQKYVNIRIKSVIAQIEGVRSTSSSHYLLQLDYIGDSFYDRDFDRNLMHYETPSRQRIYEYQVSTDCAMFADHGESWSKQVNPVTPFSKWQISIPKVETNTNITFDSPNVSLTLSFVIEARIKDVPVRLQRVQRNGGITKKELVNIMATTPYVLNGWDVVLNLDLHQINESLRKQYDELCASKPAGYTQKVSVTTETKIAPNRYGLKRIEFHYGYPLMSFFNLNDTQVSLKMEIPEGEIHYGMKTFVSPAGKTEGEWKEEWFEEFDPITDTFLQASVPVTGASGKTSDGLHDTLDAKIYFSSGSFSVENMELDPVEKIEVAKQIKAFFVANEIVYTINQLDLTPYSVSGALTPSAFNFRMLKVGQEKQILQVFIQTDRRAALDRCTMQLNNVSDPLPDGSEVSLMISNKILFQNLLPDAFNNSPEVKEWKLCGVKPIDANHPWSSKTSSGSMSVTKLDLSSLRWKDNHQFGATNYTHDYTAKDDTVIFSARNITLSKPIAQERYGTISFRMENRNESHIFVHTRSYNGKLHSRHEYHQNFSVVIDAPIAMALSGTERSQSITISVNDVADFSHIDTGIDKDAGCGLKDLDQRFAILVESRLPGMIESALREIKFPDLSVFALQNLLFPCQQYITFTDIATPGEVLLIGKFEGEK